MRASPSKTTATHSEYGTRANVVAANLQMFSKLGDGACSDGLLAFDDLANAPGDVCLGCLRFGRLVDSNNEVWHDMRRDLHVRLHKGSEEIEDRLERNACNQRRMRDIVDVLE